MGKDATVMDRRLLNALSILWVCEMLMKSNVFIKRIEYGVQLFIYVFVDHHFYDHRYYFFNAVYEINMN